MMSGMYAVADVEDVLRVAAQFPVFPCKFDKSPYISGGFLSATQDEQQIRQWWIQWPDALVGVPTGSRTSLVIVDYDPAKEDEGATAWIQEHSSAISSTRTHHTRRDGRHWAFTSREVYSSGADVWLGGVKRRGIDVRAEGGYIIWWPAHGGQATGEIQALPAAMLADRVRIMPSNTAPQTGQQMLVSDSNWAAERERVIAALAFVDPSDRDHWVKVGQGIHVACAGNEDGFNVWHHWSAGGFTGSVPENYLNIKDCRYAWSSFNRRLEGKTAIVTLGTLFALAYAAGFPPMAKIHLNSMNSEIKKSPSLFWPSDADAYEPPPELVSNFLPKVGLVLLYGPSSSGKTAFGTDLFQAVALGGSWRNRVISDGGGLVIYAAVENPGSVKLRLKGYLKQNPDAILMPFAIYPKTLHVAEAASVVELLETIREAEAKTQKPCVAVVIDTLAAAMVGLDENSVRDMTIAVDALARIRDTLGCLVAVVHHSGKDTEKGARGSSALRAAVDVEIAVSGMAGIRTATVMKQRDLPIGAAFDFTLEPIGVGFNPITNDTITTVVVVHGEESTASAKRRPTGKARIAIFNVMEHGAEGQIWTRDALQLAAIAGGALHRNTFAQALDGLLEQEFIVPTVGGYVLKVPN